MKRHIRPATLCKGFTLIELLIAVGILGILAAVVLPAVRSIGTESLEATARVLAADLRLARSSSIQFDTEFTVRFDLRNNAYEIVHTGTGNPPAPTNPLGPASQQSGLYRVELDRIGSTTHRENSVGLVGVLLPKTKQTVTDLTFGPLGGTGPRRAEDTVIWLATGYNNEARAISLTVSWVTGQVWIGSISNGLPVLGSGNTTPTVIQ